MVTAAGATVPATVPVGAFALGGQGMDPSWYPNNPRSFDEAVYFGLKLAHFVPSNLSTSASIGTLECLCKTESCNSGAGGAHNL